LLPTLYYENKAIEIWQPIKKQFIPLEDVESEHCALIVEKGLAQVKGVETHKVELNNRRAAITVNDNEVVGEAVKAIKDLGYGVPTVKKLSLYWV
jgi:Cu2+-exporting ATPase